MYKRASKFHNGSHRNLYAKSQRHDGFVAGDLINIMNIDYPTFYKIVENLNLQPKDIYFSTKYNRKIKIWRNEDKESIVIEYARNKEQYTTGAETW